ncbi:multidrug ABC transporter ATP-binding protein [Thermoplasmatales archaeon SG8-52-4]|nr:MAG: multidrug ABC transporter ATP-binding protein [Thermoplasmatales archaeon SG8-52-4]
MAVVDVNNLVKKYGPIEAVNGISFSINRGEIFGLIGPNGAGKTTTLRVLSTLLKITSGSIKIMEFDLQKEPDEVRKIISYLPEDAGAYKNLSGRKYLEFIANFFQQKNPQQMVSRGIEIANLGERIDDKVDTYSKGMMRKLLVGRAIMTEPKLAILDEPTSGLDVNNAQEIRRLVKSTARAGTTVLLSSHNMLEVEFMCDRIALISNGKIVEEGTPSNLMQKYNAKNIEEVFTQVVK